jgi:uncharacterized protein (DUF1499 family)
MPTDDSHPSPEFDLKIWKSLAAGTILVIAALVGAFLIVGPEQVWALFGSADLGPIAFETVERRTSPNDALACPPDACNAKSDMTAPEYMVNAHDLRLAFGKMISSEPRLVAVDSDDAAMTDRYIQRSKLMRFPDTIVVRFFDRPQGRSTIALYSRSQLGKGDMGVNRARIERWLSNLDTYAQVAK